MRLPRNAKIFRGQLDVAPFAGVLFLLLLFIVLQSKLVFTPVIRIDLPEVAADTPGTAGPAIIVALDRAGQMYYDNQAVTSLADLRARLQTAVQQSTQPLTLELQVDQSVPMATMAPLLSVARQAGLRKAQLAARPRMEPIVKTTRQ